MVQKPTVTSNCYHAGTVPCNLWAWPLNHISTWLNRWDLYHYVTPMAVSSPYQEVIYPCIRG